ncbi:MAG: anthranilate phosphoribosyltransferase [Fimbriimonadaceae bacterium]|nr:anthranilate phosphoribosyltransferase [Fimbriimonadaceae bacterium]
MEFREALANLIAQKSLSADEAHHVMSMALSEKLTEAQIAGLLIAVAGKGASGEELAGFATAMREHSVGFQAPYDVVDTCGTGGGSASFNISTGAAIVLAACGVKVAKHGNRAVTSSCGSADVLEALGVRITNDSVSALHLLNTVGIAFLFAPSYHPALKAIGKVRKELQVRTVFNQLGPLANPAGASSQVIGVYDRTLIRPTAEAMAMLGIKRGLVVRGTDGLDEISPCASTEYMFVNGRELTEGKYDPKDFSIDGLSPSQILPGSTVEENSSILREALTGAHPRSQALIPSAAAALWLVRGGALIDSASEARDALESGKAIAKLEELIEVSSNA